MSYFQQISFLRFVEAELPTDYTLHHFLMDFFDISRSAAYARIMGERDLRSEEIAKLSAEFPQALEKFFAQPKNLGDYALSQTSQFSDEEELWVYLDRIRSLFQRAVEAEAVLYYTALDYPLFYFLADPDLLNYKFAFWTNRILESGIQPLRPNTQRLAREIYDLYRQCSSEEIWSARMVERQEEQVQVMADLALITEVQARTLNRAFAAVHNQVKQDLKSKGRGDSVSFQVYQAPYSTLCNGGVLVFPQGESIYMGAFSTAQFIRSCSQQVVRKFREDFEGMKGISRRLGSTLAGVAR